MRQITLSIIFSILFILPSPSWGLSNGELVDWDSAEGIKRLDRSTARADFFSLANAFIAQPNRVYCAPATGAMVLNALRYRKPGAKLPLVPLAESERVYFPKDKEARLPGYTPDTFFTAEVERIKPHIEVLGKPVEGKADWGIQLRQFQRALQAHGADVEIRVADKSLSDETIRKEIIENLKRTGDYVIANYSRVELKQPGTGHIAPVAAYDQVSDSFLVLDVNTSVAPWTWVKASALIRAMRTFDTIENRGYLLVKEGAR